MKHKEASFGIHLRHWLKANPQYSSVYELKQCKGASLPFAALEEHQATYLEAIASDKGTLIRVQGISGEPDYVYLRSCPAYVVVKYPGSFHFITIGTWLLEKSKSTRKSLTSARAKEISTVSVILG